MANNQLTTLTLSNGATLALSNKELASNIKTLQKLAQSENKTVWATAKVYYDIVTGNQFVDDFKSERKFASAVGIGKSQLANYVSVVDVATRFNIDVNKCSATKVIQLLPFTDEIINEVINSLGDTLYTMSVKELKEYLKVYKDIVEDVATDEAIESEDVETEETATDNTGDMVEFEVLGKTYRMPMEVLARYEV